MRTPPGTPPTTAARIVRLLVVGAATAAAGCGGCNDTGPRPDFDTDASDVGDADGSGDAVVRTTVQVGPAGATVEGDSNRLTIRFGAPQPVGEGSGSESGVVVGPGAARP